MAEDHDPVEGQSADVVRYGAPLSAAQRLVNDLVRLLCGAVVVALPISLFCQEVLRLPMPQWRIVLYSSAAIGALAGRRYLWRNRWNMVVIDGDTIHLDHEGRKQAAVPPQDVLLVQGEAGFTQERDVIDWRFVRLTTHRGAYRIVLHPEECRDCYEHLVQLCPQAVGVSYYYDVRIPASPPGWTATQWLDSVARVVRRALRRQVGVLVVTAVVLAVSSPLLGFAATQVKDAGDAGKAWGWSIVGMVLAVTFALGGLRRWWLGRRAMQEIRRERNELERSSHAATEYAGRTIDGVRPLRSHGEKSDRRRATALALLSFLAFCIPGVSLLLAGWSFYFGRRANGWPRYLSIFAVVVSLIGTVLMLYLLVRAR